MKPRQILACKSMMKEMIFIALLRCSSSPKIRATEEVRVWCKEWSSRFRYRIQAPFRLAFYVWDTILGG